MGNLHFNFLVAHTVARLLASNWKPIGPNQLIVNAAFFQRIAKQSSPQLTCAKRFKLPFLTFYATVSSVCFVP